eukprot:gene25851-biopygen17856
MSRGGRSRPETSRNRS